jgi:predicted transcriptional regulator
MSNSDDPTNVMRNEKLESEVMEIVINTSTGTWIEDIARRTGKNRATIKNEVTRLEAIGKIHIERKGNLKMIWPAKK